MIIIQVQVFKWRSSYGENHFKPIKGLGSQGAESLQLCPPCWLRPPPPPSPSPRPPASRSPLEVFEKQSRASLQPH